MRELSELPDFRAAKSLTLPWTSRLSGRELIDLYLTRSTLSAVVRVIGLRRVMEALTTIAAEEAGPEGFEIGWETTVKWAKRK